MGFFPQVQLRFHVLLISLFFVFPAHAQGISRAELDAAKATLELRILEARTDAALAQQEAELREAERAALLARLPPAGSRASRASRSRCARPCRRMRAPSSTIPSPAPASSPPAA
jgi:hypothetical protein